jgi:hypothetical protein
MMNIRKSPPFGPKNTDVGPMEEKTGGSNKDKEELIEELSLTDEENENVAENNQSEPKEIISNPQEIQKKAKKSRESNCS